VAHDKRNGGHGTNGKRARPPPGKNIRARGRGNHPDKAGRLPKGSLLAHATREVATMPNELPVMPPAAMVSTNLQTLLKFTRRSIGQVLRLATIVLGLSHKIAEL